MVQYFTLQEAAERLRVTPEALKEMAKNGEIRAFQDRGNLRFRTQEVNELARAKGLGSDPELQLGEAPAPKPHSSPRPTAHAPAEPGLYDFTQEDDSDEVPLGQENLAGPGKTPSSKARKSPSPSPKPHTPVAGGSPSSGRKVSKPKTPPPPAGSDSDVRLVADGSDLNFNIEADSNQLVPKESPSKSGPRSGPKPGGSSSKRSPRPAPVDDKPDSGVRIVPLDQASDSDVQIEGSTEGAGLGQMPPRGASDSDIRLEQVPPGKGGSRSRSRSPQDNLVTEEIDLDAEALLAEEAARKKQQKPKTQAKSHPPAPPAASPFELSDTGAGPKTPSPKTPPPKKPSTKDSSDFELTPLGLEDSSPVEMSSDEIDIQRGDEEVSLGELTGAAGGSGINLRDPADSGISLEQGGSDEIEFELTLDSKATPKPSSGTSKRGGDDSSSNEFELSLSDEPAAEPDSGSESEFELSLDTESSSGANLDAAKGDSDSEFELTLDESGGLAVEGEEEASGEEKDIFETDFEVPALEDESGSEVAALDEGTDEETSDFDLAGSPGESGSEVVSLEDGEEADEEAPTVARPKRGKGRAAALLDEEEEDETLREPDEDEGRRVVTVPEAPAEWGILPALGLIPSVLILFVVALMGFELVEGMWGYHKGSRVSGMIIHPIAKILDEKLPDD